MTDFIWWSLNFWMCTVTDSIVFIKNFGCTSRSSGTTVLKNYTSSFWLYKWTIKNSFFPCIFHDFLWSPLFIHCVIHSVSPHNNTFLYCLYNLIPKRIVYNNTALDELMICSIRWLEFSGLDLTLGVEFCKTRLNWKLIPSDNLCQNYLNLLIWGVLRDSRLFGNLIMLSFCFIHCSIAWSMPIQINHRLNPFYLKYSEFPGYSPALLAATSRWSINRILVCWAPEWKVVRTCSSWISDCLPVSAWIRSLHVKDFWTKVSPSPISVFWLICWVLWVSIL